MANARLESKDLYSPNIMKPLIGEFEALQAQIKATNTLISELKKANLDAVKSSDYSKSAEELDKMNASLAELTKLRKSDDQIAKQQLKLREQMAQAVGEEAVETEKLKIQLREARKATREIAQEALNGSNAYKELSAKTNAAQADFKRLAAQFGVTSKEAKAAQKEFEELSDRLQEIDKAARDGRRNVGRYAESLEAMRGQLDKVRSAAEKTNKILGAIGLLKILELLTGAFNKNEQGAAATEKAMGALNIVLGVFIKNVIAAFEASNNLFDVFTNLQSSFSGMKDEVADLIAVNNKLIDQTIAFRNAEADAVAQVAKMRETQAALEVQAGNSTLSLFEQIDAQRQLNAVNQRIADLERERLENNLILAREQAEVDMNSSSARLALAEATMALAEFNAQANAQQLDGIRVIAEAERDIFEQRLDFQIDIFDSVKTSNERILADETRTFREREKALADNIRMFKQAQELQAANVNASLRSRGKAEIDFTKLMEETSTERVLAMIEEVGANEIETNRLLELYRERRTAELDLVDSRKELAEAERESNETFRDTIAIERARALIAAQGEEVTISANRRRLFAIAGLNQELKNLADAEEDRNNRLNELEEKRAQNRIDAIRRQLAEIRAMNTASSEEEVALNNELQQALLDQDIFFAEKRRQAEEKEIQKRIENQKKVLKAAQDGLELIEAASQRAFEARNERINEELTREEERQNRLIELAEEGNELAERTLAESERRQAELRREQAEQERRQKAAELALATLKTYTAKVEQGDQQPLVSTVADIGLLQAYVANLPAFKEGIEMVGKDGGHKLGMFAEDDFLARLHKGEAVFTAEDNALRPPGMSNTEVMLSAQWAAKAASGQMQGEAARQGMDVEIKALLQEIRDKPVYLGRDYDATQKAVIDRIAERNKFVNKHFNNKGFKR